MNWFPFLTALLIVYLAQCGGPPTPVARPKPEGPIQIPAQPIDPCANRSGIGFSPVGRIFVKDPARTRETYGTHVLVDQQGQVIWLLQSNRVNLNSYAGNQQYYRVDSSASNQFQNLLIVCNVLPP